MTRGKLFVTLAAAVWVLVGAYLVFTAPAKAAPPTPKSLQVFVPYPGYTTVAAAWLAVPGAKWYQLYIAGLPVDVQAATPGAMSEGVHFSVPSNKQTRVSVASASVIGQWSPRANAVYFNPGRCVP